MAVAGIAPAPQQRRWRVEGMDCAGCARTIEQALARDWDPPAMRAHAERFSEDQIARQVRTQLGQLQNHARNKGAM